MICHFQFRRKLMSSTTEGVYIPPFKVARLRKDEAVDANLSQLILWEALKKSINGLINKVNTENIKNIATELFQENIFRGKGILVRAILKAQMASPSFSNVYAALVAVINSKFPDIGELVVKRTVKQLLKSYRRNDKMSCLSCTFFLAHLVNQQVAHEIVAMEFLYLLLDKPTNDSVELSAQFIKSCGFLLSELIPKGLHAVFERLRCILQEGDIDMRVQCIIEDLFAIRKNKFVDYPPIIEQLDLVEVENQIPHEVFLNSDIDTEPHLDVFSFDPDYEHHESEFAAIREQIEDPVVEEGEDLDEVQCDSESEKTEHLSDHIDPSGDIAFRKRIYLTIMSSANYEECAHKLQKNLIQGKERIVADMLLECCLQERTFLKFYGLIAQRFCKLHRIWVETFDELFADQYSTIHRLETGKIRNAAKFFAFLLQSVALDWGVLEYVILTEDETNSSSRIFLKILFQELLDNMGIDALRSAFYSPENGQAFGGFFSRDSLDDLRFAINFFTSIGLGELTQEMRVTLATLQGISNADLEALNEHQKRRKRRLSD